MSSVRTYLLCALVLGFMLPAEVQATPPGAMRQVQPAGKLRVKARAARRWAVKKLWQVRRKVKFERRVRRARDRFLATPAGKRVRRVVKKTRRLTRAVRGQLTHTADRIEGRLPPGSRRARLFGRLRRYSPVSLPAFSYRKFKQDPVFLGAYKGFSLTAGYVAPPLMLKMGAGVTASLLVPSLILTPLDLGLVFGREHQLKKRRNPGQTLRQTARELGREYREFAHQQRDRNRRYYDIYTRRFWGKGKGAGEVRTSASAPGAAGRPASSP